MATNEILKFGTTAAGGNIMSQATYAADPQRDTGHQPGIARQELENKALLQLSTIAAGVAQFIADRQAINVTDALTAAQIAALMSAGFTGRRIRTTRYVRVAGVQNISVDGGANTTTGAGSFTRHPNTRFAIMKVQGGGSGGAGANAPAGGLVSLGSPGCAGSYGESIFDAATIGASPLTVVVGLGSAGSSAAAGGASSVGVIISAAGGVGAGTLGSQTPPVMNGNGTLAAAPSGANLVSIQGSVISLSIALNSTTGFGGAGGTSQFGAGGNNAILNTNGTNAVNPGSGGSGAVVNSGGGSATGGNGASGIVIIEEYE